MSKTDKPKLGFEYKGCRENEDCQFGEPEHTYVAEMPLPDDGCPGPPPQRVLRVTVHVREEPGGQVCEVSLHIVQNRVREVLSRAPIHVDPTQDLLYGAARMVTVKRIEPV